MTRYDSFDCFMKEVVEQAKRRSDVLKAIYDIRNLGILVTIISILGFGGFGLLVAIGVLIAVGWLGLPISIPIFLGTPLGWALLAIFGTASATTIWAIYRDRRILSAVVDLGKKVRAPWDLLERQQAGAADFDRLFEEAVVALLITPKEFYKEHRDPARVQEMYNDYINNIESPS